MMSQLLTQNVLVQTKIKSLAVHVGHSQLQPYSHKVDVYKVLINNLYNTHKNTLLLVIQLIWVAMVVGYQWYGNSYKKLVISHLAVFHTNQEMVLQENVQLLVMMDQPSQSLLKLLITQMFVQVKNLSRMLYTTMVVYKLLSQFTMISKFILVVFMNTHGDHTWVDMLLHLSVMVKKMVLNTGKYKTVGVKVGEKMVSSELSEVLMNVVLKINASKVITDQ